MADYTTLAVVKRTLGSAESADDVLLAELITQASRAIDRFCAGVNSDNYFARETLLDVITKGRIASDGVLFCWPPKPIIESISALAYRYSARENWIVLDVSGVEINGYSVSVDGVNSSGNVQVRISFTGGFNPLPDDLINAVTLLTVRFYKEVKTGLSDSIGVAELGMLQYTKALPERLVAMIRPYKRIVP
jgi:hypothetical protein